MDSKRPANGQHEDAPDQKKAKTDGKPALNLVSLTIHMQYSIDVCRRAGELYAHDAAATAVATVPSTQWQLCQSVGLL
jgi:hypothetical protein